MGKPVKKGQIVEGRIIDINSQGKGVLRVDNFAIFTDKGIIDELVEVEIVKLERNYGIGKTVKIKEESDHRVEPKCKVFERCGGCQLQEISYKKQLDFKKSKVEDAIERIGKLDGVKVNDILGMDDPFRYRNNVQVPIGRAKGKAILGNYEKESNRIVDREECIIESEIADKAIELVREYIDRFNVPVYSRRTNTGLLRHVIIRTSELNDDVMIIFVTTDKLLPRQEELKKILSEGLPTLKGIMQNINDERTSVVMGESTFPIYGDDYIIDEIDGLEFKISPESFFQVNTKQAKVLYDVVLDYAALTGEEIVVDLYSGIGTIALYMAREAGMVYGIESNGKAVDDAVDNATINEMDDVGFIEGKVENVLPILPEEDVEPDIIVVDPPRKGCDEEVLNLMMDLEPKKIIYVSCNPSTLARDLRILDDGGYKVKQVQPVDMFPQSIHVETVALLEKE